VISGGRAYDPDGTGTLRLSVLTFETRSVDGPPMLRLPRKAGERQIGGGTQPNDRPFDVYERDTTDDG